MLSKLIAAAEWKITDLSLVLTKYKSALVAVTVVVRVTTKLDPEIAGGVEVLMEAAGDPERTRLLDAAVTPV